MKGYVWAFTCTVLLKPKPIIILTDHEACNEFACPSTQHSAKATAATCAVDVEAVAILVNRLQHCARLAGLGFDFQMFRT